MNSSTTYKIVFLLFSCIGCYMVSKMLSGFVLTDIWTTPSNMIEWRSIRLDPREYILGLRVFSLRYLDFRLFFFTLFVSTMFLIAKVSQLSSISFKALIQHCAIVIILGVAHGLCIGYFVLSFWETRIKSNNMLNYQAIFGYDLVFTIWSSVIELLFSAPLFVSCLLLSRKILDNPKFP